MDVGSTLSSRSLLTPQATPLTSLQHSLTSLSLSWTGPSHVDDNPRPFKRMNTSFLPFGGNPRHSDFDISDDELKRLTKLASFKQSLRPVATPISFQALTSSPTDSLDHMDISSSVASLAPNLKRKLPIAPPSHTPDFDDRFAKLQQDPRGSLVVPRPSRGVFNYDSSPNYFF